ncbi:hypothetical protein FNV43_RR19743 [Rhamnella rubrinervis]|uniref:Uncharacterized protein n=1 Tax=Rhamnella rubrinervis TaxID=2594499 RepID=A0A8K0GWI3_9ROSA|nr:hypothetical protein FNV43_RR19743 [Rhamnella rubrinervis]
MELRFCNPLHLLLVPSICSCKSSRSRTFSAWSCILDDNESQKNDIIINVFWKVSENLTLPSLTDRNSVKNLEFLN